MSHTLNVGQPPISVETFVPTVMLGFRDGKLHQAWIGTLGSIEWRLVGPVSKQTKVPPQCVVGHVDMEREDEPASS